MTAVSTSIPHSRPFLGEEERAAADEVLRTGQLAQGPCVERFESSLAAWLGVRGGVAVSSGTVALELALAAVGVAPGDEVIIPSYVCAAVWLAVQRIGALPRLVDIDLATFNLDPEAAARAVTAKTRAIIVPHLFGLPADLTRLQALGIPLIEDCAQTLGALESGRPVATVGVAAICSFYATKLLCTGEGGMVVSNDGALLEHVRSLRQYDDGPMLNPSSSNRKLTDLQAAIGLCQVNRLAMFLQRRAEIAARYRTVLAQMPLVLPAVPAGRTHVYYRFVVRLPRLLKRPDSLAAQIMRLNARGLQCRRPVFRPLHRYLDLDGFPASEEADRTALSIPIYPSMTDDEVARVIQILGEELA